MKSIAIFYGTSTSNTLEAAQDIAKALESRAAVKVDLIDVCRMPPERLQEHTDFLIGCPTWDVGELQGDWDRIHRKLGSLRFEGATIALFGCGDALGYPDTFQDALGILGKDFRDRGARIVGMWPTEGYDFEDSLGVENGNFFGLALDYDNFHKKCPEQIQGWVTQLIAEWNLPAPG